ncbi:holo-ACP synthase [Rappaport israeli]|uniref:holo-ACP synthase n=1 Tax=Rappaport israeli TaxID=1839807 RepID=UPI0009317CD8|nr:holo-ACP synthase [Rappaport israeli]
MIGTDLIDKRRIAQAYQRHGHRLTEKILHPSELTQFNSQQNPIRYLSMRWAAKEAFAKALGTGLRAPVLMSNICITHNAQGAPSFTYTDAIADLIAQRGYQTLHLSLSDETHYALAFVVAQITQPHY